MDGQITKEFRITPPESPKWKSSPVSIIADSDDDTLTLTGSTKFEPRRDVRNILVTGGAGFMSV